MPTGIDNFQFVYFDLEFVFKARKFSEQRVSLKSPSLLNISKYLSQEFSCDRVFQKGPFNHFYKKLKTGTFYKIKTRYTTIL